jgi:carbon monoxide dehydrogenase subunit G
MQMSDSQRIPASRDKVWAALNDPEVLKNCIPGCEALEMSSPTEMTATVVFKVGPVKATFSGKVTLSDLDRPKVKTWGVHDSRRNAALVGRRLRLTAFPARAAFARTSMC